MTLIQKAAQACLDERWERMAKSKSIYEMETIENNTRCKLCVINNSTFCKGCPLHETGYTKNTCCSLFLDWKGARDRNDFPAVHEAANAVCERLRTIAKG